MPNYRRLYRPGGMYFLTLNLLDRRQSLLTDHIDELRDAIDHVRVRHTFELPAIVILPDHLHCILSLPAGCQNFSTIIQQLKAAFSRSLPKVEHVSSSRDSKGERGIWQRRFWEHLIRDEDDLEQHVNYIHYNPVKHGYVKRVTDWPHSSIHRYVNEGWRMPDWEVVAQESGLDLD